MHPQGNFNESKPENTTSNMDSAAGAESNHVNHNSVPSMPCTVSHQQVLLGTALVLVTDCVGNKIPLRCVLDTAIQTSLITPTPQIS